VTYVRTPRDVIPRERDRRDETLKPATCGNRSCKHNTKTHHSRIANASSRHALNGFKIGVKCLKSFLYTNNGVSVNQINRVEIKFTFTVISI